MQSYIFLLGSTPALSLFELSQVVTSQVTELLPGVAEASLESDEQAQELMAILGGTIKIIRAVKTIPVPKDYDPLHQQLLELLEAESGKISFAISTLGMTSNDTEDIDIGQLKQDLQHVGKKARYLESTGMGLSAAILLHQHITELYVVKTDQGLLLGKTVAVQDIDDWTNRDRVKPYADRKKGLLPPKIARIMVNSALGLYTKQPNVQVEPVLYDPFCGSGTILMEGLMRNLTVVGSDLDTAAVAGAQANLAWLQEYYQTKPSFTVVPGDATRPGLLQSVQPQLLVTEPFLGKPNPKPIELANIFKGLYKLYLGAFKNWTNSLAPGAVICIVLPVVEVGKQRFSLENLVDKLPALGYTTLSEPILYRRPQAVVQRHIHWFRLKHT